MTKRKSFSQEFKREAVRLLETSEKSSADLAGELGVRRNQLYKWKEQLSQEHRQGQACIDEADGNEARSGVGWVHGATGQDRIPRSCLSRDVSRQ